jgi:capsule polysaccharide export protein KpsC/LpsZ
MLLQEHIRQATKTVGGVAHFQNSFTNKSMGKPCVAIIGSLRECMLVINQVIKDMADALSTIAQKAGAGETLQELLIDAELQFNANVDILLGFNIEYQSRISYVVYWPALEPVR